MQAVHIGGRWRELRHERIERGIGELRDALTDRSTHGMSLVSMPERSSAQKRGKAHSREF